MKSTHLHMLLMAGLFLLITDSSIFADEILFQDDIDIDDVVYLITYIFGGGPAPCAGC